MAAFTCGMQMQFFCLIGFLFMYLCALIKMVNSLFSAGTTSRQSGVAWSELSGALQCPGGHSGGQSLEMLEASFLHLPARAQRT